MSASNSPRDDLILLSRLARLDASTVSDADKSLRVLPAAIRPVSAGTRLLGRAVTANARDDLLSVLGALQHGGPGDVLVVAAGGSQRAVAGELFVAARQHAGAWAGIVIDGFCRDTATLKTHDLCRSTRAGRHRVQPALWSCPRSTCPCSSVMSWSTRVTSCSATTTESSSQPGAGAGGRYRWGRGHPGHRGRPLVVHGRRPSA